MCKESHITQFLSQDQVRHMDPFLGHLDPNNKSKSTFLNNKGSKLMDQKTLPPIWMFLKLFLLVKNQTMLSKALQTQDLLLDDSTSNLITPAMGGLEGRHQSFLSLDGGKKQNNKTLILKHYKSTFLSILHCKSFSESST